MVRWRISHWFPGLIVLTSAFSVAWYCREKGEVYTSDKWDNNPWYISRKRCITSTYFYSSRQQYSWGNERITYASCSPINRCRVYFNEKGKKYLIFNIVSGQRGQLAWYPNVSVWNCSVILLPSLFYPAFPLKYNWTPGTGFCIPFLPIPIVQGGKIHLN